MGVRENDAVSILVWEAKLRDYAMQCYRQWAPIAMNAVMPTLTAAVGEVPPDAEAIMMTEPQWQQILKDTFIPGIEQMSDERVYALLQAAGVAFPAGVIASEALHALPSYEQWRSAYLGDVFNRMVNTPDDVFRGIAADLEKGLEAGESAYDLGRRVREHLSMDDEGGMGRWMIRSETVARTEATGAYNASHVAAAQVQSEVFGQELEQVWIATMDSRTRKSHFAADGQRRKLGAKFNVGRAELRYPGDPRGPAKEVVNCRCTVLTLEPDDELPDENDRQTERQRSDGTTRDPAAEVARRSEEEGITRARDDDDGEGKITAAAGGDRTMVVQWKGILAPLGVETGDGRIFAADATFTFREFPLPLMWQEQTGYGHESAYTVGAILEASVVNGQIEGSGVMFESPEAVKAIELLNAEGGPVTRPSVDLCDDEWVLVGPDGAEISEQELWDAWDRGEEPDVLMQVTSATIMGATLVAKPAFAQAKIEIVDSVEAPADETDETEPADDAETPPAEPTEEDVENIAASLIASAGSEAGFVPDAAMFDDPKFTRITPLHMDDNGRVKGHLAQWGVCHVGISDRCVTAPHSQTDYSYFHVSEVHTTEGVLPVGRLTIGGGHANGKAGVLAAVEHYDNAGAGWAMVRAGEDEFGIWVSGVPHPAATKQQVLDGATHPLSGDWRRVGGNLELVAALGVVSGGFPIPRGANDSKGRAHSLVASGIVPIPKDSTRSADSIARISESAARKAVDEYVRRQNDLAALASLNAKIVTDRRGTADRLAASLTKG